MCFRSVSLLTLSLSLSLSLALSLAFALALSTLSLSLFLSLFLSLSFFLCLSLSLSLSLSTWRCGDSAAIITVFAATNPHIHDTAETFPWRPNLRFLDFSASQRHLQNLDLSTSSPVLFHAPHSTPALLLPVPASQRHVFLQSALNQQVP
jgi:hypothetical protein